MSYILVTGGAGFIGSVLSNNLVKNYKVIVIDNLFTGKKNFLSKKIIFFKIDICNLNKLKKVFNKYKISSVFHLAALKSVVLSEKKKKLYYQNNIIGTNNLIKCIINYKVKRIIFSSSCSVYGNTESNNVNEKERINPISYYAKTKVECEKKIIIAAKKNKIKYAILRYFNVIGAEKNLKSGEVAKGSLFKNLSYNIYKKKLSINIYGNHFKTKDGSAIRDYIDVNDLINLHILSLKKLLKSSSFIINCGYGVGYSVKQVIKCFEKIINKKITIHYKSKRKGEVDMIIADNKKMLSLLPKWKRKFSLRKSIKNSINWEKKYFSN